MLESLGICTSLGYYRELAPSMITGATEKFRDDATEWKKMAEAGPRSYGRLRRFKDRVSHIFTFQTNRTEFRSMVMTHSGSVLDRSHGFSVLDCTDCGFIHLNPVPSEDDLDRVYREEYYRDEKPLFIERVREDLAWWESVYNDRYEFFESRLPVEQALHPRHRLRAWLLPQGWSREGLEGFRSRAFSAGREPRALSRDRSDKHLL